MTTCTLPMMPMQAKTIFFGLGAQMYMTQEIKAPLMKAVEVLFNSKSPKFHRLKALKVLWDAFESMKGLPEPTKENTWHPNTHNLIDLRDSLFNKCELGILRMGFIRRIMNFVIIIYDFDPPWRFILDSLLQDALKMKWEPRGYNDTWVKTYTWWKE